MAMMFIDSDQRGTWRLELCSETARYIDFWSGRLMVLRFFSSQMLWVQMIRSHLVAMNVDVCNDLRALDDLGMIWSHHTDIWRMKSRGVGIVRGGSCKLEADGSPESRMLLPQASIVRQARRFSRIYVGQLDHVQSPAASRL